MLEIVLVILLILAFFMVAYKGAIHEFQILQKDWKPTIEWSALLSEQLPIVIRNVDPTWQGTWTRAAVANKPWPVQVRKEGTLFKTQWNKWLSAPPGQPPLTPETLHEISSIVKSPIALWEDAGFRRWSWIPAHLTQTTMNVLDPQSTLPIRKTTAAATLIQATDGAPLQLWLAHEGAIPDKVAIVGKNPWSITTDTHPWISEVKFIELRLRPGNALVIPTHWYWAARVGESSYQSDENATVAAGSWYWQTDWQSPISWIVSKVHPQK